MTHKITREVLYQKYIIEEKSGKKVANELDVGTTTVFRKLKEYDIFTRNISEANKGHIPWNKGLKFKELPLNIQKTLIKYRIKKGEHRSRVTEFKKGHKPTPFTETHKRNMSESRKGKKRPDLTKRNLENNPMWDPKIKEKAVRNILKGLIKRPTSFEKKIIYLNEKYGLPFDYVGDGQVLINFKNPDFINNNGQKKLIEVYHDYFKIRTHKSCERYEKMRSERFAKFGFKTLFLNDSDILRKDWEEHCLNKINAFCGI